MEIWEEEIDRMKDNINVIFKQITDKEICDYEE